MYPRLFSPLTIGGATLRNRIVMAAFNHAWCKDGLITNEFVTHYTRMAAGGAGLIVPGGFSIDPVGAGTAMPGIFDDRFTDGLTRLAAGLKKEGAVAFAQLFHAGRYAKKDSTGFDSVGPSAVFSTYSKSMPRELESGEMPQIAEQFISSAGRAKQCGFDGVELIASAGYLLASFLSPVTNLRSDAYGGSPEKAARLLCEIISGIKTRCGKEFAVTVRLSGNEFIKGGNSPAETARNAQILEAAGADGFSVTGGWHEAPIPQITFHVPPGTYTYLAAAVKNAVRVPVIMANRIAEPKLAEALLAQGMADAAVMARALICDPALPNKAREGRDQFIRPCISCGQGCTDTVFSGRPLFCALNMEISPEPKAIRPAAAPKKILVIGGGMAGMEAALRSAQRGHRVELWEKEARLGGHMIAAAALRPEIARWLDHMPHALAEAGVSVHLAREAVATDAGLKNFDHIVLAVGSTIKPLPFDCSAFAGQVLEAPDVWRNIQLPGQNVVIIGAGALGAETAAHLAKNSAMSGESLRFLMLQRAESAESLDALARTCRRRITLLDSQPKIGRGLGISNKWAVMKDLALFNVEQKGGCAAIGVSARGLICRDEQGVESELPCDTIINATGFARRAQFAEAVADGLAGAPVSPVLIGDALAPASMVAAVKKAFDTALEF